MDQAMAMDGAFIAATRNASTSMSCHSLATITPD